MKKLSSITVYCLFFTILIAAGCAKKAPKSPIVPQDESAEAIKPETPITESEIEPGAKEFVPESPYEEETIGGTKETILGSSDMRKELKDDFREAPGTPGVNGTFESTPLLSAIHFDFDRYSIKSEDRDILSKNASWLIENSSTFVKIEGHCDERGTLDYNLALGERRANATKNYLVSLGVDSSRISIITYGEEKPLCSEENADCWSQNRRAEFLVTE